MKFALAILIGAALIIGLPGMLALYGAIGVLTGLAMVLAEMKWPKTRPTYINPVNRPRPTTPASGYVQAFIVAAASGLLAVVALKIVLPAAPAYGSVGIYLAALGAGMAIGMVLTARRTSEAHNRWLAAMSPNLLGNEQ